MEYKIELGIWKSIFAVPGDVVEDYLRDLNEAQIKTLLCVLKYSYEKINVNKISELCNLDCRTVEQSLERLFNMGILSKESVSSDCKVEENKSFGKDFSVGKTGVLGNRSEVRYKRPSASYIAQRMQSSKDISYMMQEAEVILKRPLSGGDSAVLLMLHDNDGLPLDVILMLLQYTVDVGKANMKYISKTGQNWAKDGVDNLEKAEKKIKNLNHTFLIWKKFENLIGIDHRSPTSAEEETVLRWFDLWNFSDDMVKEAYDRCVNKNGKYVLKYMDSIIKRWHTQGIVTIEQALLENKSRKNGKSAKGKSLGASYSIDEYENFDFLDYVN